MAYPNHLFYSTYTIYSIYTFEQEQCSSGIQAIFALQNIVPQGDRDKEKEVKRSLRGVILAPDT